MPKFAYTGPAEILHINARKEGKEDDKELAADIKMMADKVPAEILKTLGDGLEQLLFFDDNMKAVRNTMMEPIGFRYEIEGYRLAMLGRMHYGCKVKKITVTPQDGGTVCLSFSVSFKPSGNEFAQIAEYLAESVSIEVGPASEELDLGEGGKDKVAELNDRLSEIVPDASYAAAKEIVVKSGRASISLVQRELRIGYNHAARLLEAMEKAGVVSAMDAGGVRRVLQKEAA